MPLGSASCRFADTESWPQPAPERGRDQQLHAPAEQTRPLEGLWGPAETSADAARTLLQQAVPPQSLDDHRGSIPAPRVEPVGQAADGMATSKTEKTPHPDDDPGRFGQTSHLAAIQAVADQLQNATRFPCPFAANDTELRTQLLDEWRIRTERAQLLDRDGEAVYNNHCFVRGGGVSRVSAKRRAPPPPLPSCSTIDHPSQI